MVHQKSVVVAYILFLVGGIFGLHLFYLRRDNHLILHQWFFGNFFGLGLLYDFFAIPSYVRDINEEEGYMKILKTTMEVKKFPPFGLGRAVAVYVIAFGACRMGINSSVNGEVKTPLIILVGLLLGVTATWLVGNVGRHKISYLKLLVAGSVTIACDTMLEWPYGDTGETFGTITGAGLVLASIWFREWQPLNKHKRERTDGICRRSLRIGVYVGIWYSLVVVAIYFNGTLELAGPNGRTTTTKIHEVFEGPEWEQLKENLFVAYTHFSTNGFGKIWEEIANNWDPRGSALQTLGLDETATENDIKKRYRKLAVTYHPDKNPQNKKEAKEKWEEIVAAYEVLTGSSKKSRGGSEPSRRRQ